MKTRIEAGTDIATLGVWDAELQKRSNIDRSLAALDREATQANLFLIRTGGDGGGPVDVYVDEAIPSAARRLVRRVGREHLIHIPSGRFIVAGAEDYQTTTPQTIGQNSQLEIPPGDYAITCYSPKEEVGFDPPSQKQLCETLGATDYRYYRRVQKLSLMGYLNLLWFPLLWPMIGWMLALGVTVVVLSSYFYVQEELLLKRNARYQAIVARVNSVWRATERAAAPTLILALRRVSNTNGLAGGSVRLDAKD